MKPKPLLDICDDEDAFERESESNFENFQVELNPQSKYVQLNTPKQEESQLIL